MGGAARPAVGPYRKRQKRDGLRKMRVFDEESGR